MGFLWPWQEATLFLGGDQISLIEPEEINQSESQRKLSGVTEAGGAGSDCGGRRSSVTL